MRNAYNFLLYQQHRQELQMTARKMAAPATINPNPEKNGIENGITELESTHEMTLG